MHPLKYTYTETKPTLPEKQCQPQHNMMRVFCLSNDFLIVNIHLVHS